MVGLFCGLFFWGGVVWFCLDSFWTLQSDAHENYQWYVNYTLAYCCDNKVEGKYKCEGRNRDKRRMKRRIEIGLTGK